MTDGSEPGIHARRSLLRRALGAGAAVLLGAPMREARAEEVQVIIDNKLRQILNSPVPVTMDDISGFGRRT